MTLRASAIASLAIALLLLGAPHSAAQNRGVYPLGMGALQSGSAPPQGFAYTNLFLMYARDRSKGPEGEVVATGQNSVLMDMNTVTWGTGRRVLGASVSLAATLPFANNSLSSDVSGARSGGGGFADSYYQPLILGWKLSRADVKLAYGFLAPTGRFEAGATDNVGSGYWTHTLASGQSIYLTHDRTTVLSAFEMYELHGEQQETAIDPGDNLNLDASVTRTFALQPDLHLQVGAVGYAQWQTTAKSNPEPTPEESDARYRIYALGGTAGLTLPERRVSLMLKYFDEFECRSTFEGYSLQISASVAF